MHWSQALQNQFQNACNFDFVVWLYTEITGDQNQLDTVWIREINAFNSKLDYVKRMSDTNYIFVHAE